MTKNIKPTEKQKALLKATGFVSSKNQQISCDCGCAVRGLTEYQLSAYRQNDEVYSFMTYDQKLKKEKKVTTKKHHNGHEHVWGASLGYHDRAIKGMLKAMELIRKVMFEVALTQELADSIEWFELWDCTNSELIDSFVVDFENQGIYRKDFNRG